MNLTINEIKNVYKKSKNHSYNKKNCYDIKWFFYILILLQVKFI